MRTITPISTNFQRQQTDSSSGSRSATLLTAPSPYDRTNRDSDNDDDASIRSPAPSDQDTDSEDDELINAARSTLELARHDRSVLEDEEELERLVTVQQARKKRPGPVEELRRIFSGGTGSADDGNAIHLGAGGQSTGGKRERRKEKRDKRRERRREKAARRHRKRGSSLSGSKDEEGELMFEMEEGYRDDISEMTSSTSSDVDRGKANGFYGRPIDIRKRNCRRFTWVHAIIALGALIVLFGAYKAAKTMRVGKAYNPHLLSNGTSTFAATTILISLDGFRADFLNRGLTPTLNRFVAEGVSPKYMTPSFPSVTFPNHFTLVTGLYPESHGVVGNTFWDPELKEEFYYTHTEVSMLPKWWNAEPLWVTAETQGVRSAIHMWPGSEAHIQNIDPMFLDKYNGSEILSRKVDRVLGFLDLPSPFDLENHVPGTTTRPQFIAAYVPNVDADGHRYGPNSTEIRSTISAVDSMLASLFAGLEARNLTDIVNVVIVSDHGMATTSIDRVIQLDDLIDMEMVDHIDGWPLRGLRPKEPQHTQLLHLQLLRALNDTPSLHNGMEVHLRTEMPERYHFSNNDRIAPLWVIPKTGWAIVERPDFDLEQTKASGEDYHPHGIHGYDHEHPLMRAIFVARGPAFPHPKGARLDPFQNINVYNIICDSLGMKPHSNNGTLRLPLKPVGVHGDEGDTGVDIVDDPFVIVGDVKGEDENGVPEVEDGAEPGAVDEPVSQDEPVKSEPETADGDGDDEKEEQKSWWDLFHEAVEQAKDWASGVLEGVGIGK